MPAAEYDGVARLGHDLFDERGVVRVVGLRAVAVHLRTSGSSGPRQCAPVCSCTRLGVQAPACLLLLRARDSVCLRVRACVRACLRVRL